MYRTYKVIWMLEGKEETKFEARCMIVKGDTTFADIPKMLAIKRGWDIEQIVIVSAKLISTEDAI